MATAGRGIVVSGLSDLQKAWRVADAETAKEFRSALREAAEPVRKDAARLARISIPRNTPAWSAMRVGVTQKSVYVAPKHRGTRNRVLRRPKFAGLLLNRSMIPALNINARQVEDKVEDALGKVGRKWENA